VSRPGIGPNLAHDMLRHQHEWTHVWIYLVGTLAAAVFRLQDESK
jgi:hypothetical protein